MKIRIFVRKLGGQYEGGHFGGTPVDFEALPHVGEFVSHKDSKPWLRVDIVAQGVAGAPHEIYVTEVDQLKTVQALAGSLDANLPATSPGSLGG